MDTKRIETTTSRTAEMNCVTRAASSLESTPCYRSEDWVALQLLPRLFQVLVHVPLFRSFFRRTMAPAGVYEYVIARTKYIDAVFRQALEEDFEQVLLFGAGFDTRALRLQNEIGKLRIFELDAHHTQQAKQEQYRKRRLTVPDNFTFIPIDFDKQSLPERLDAAGFGRGFKSLFILEGLLMYLEPESVQTTFQTIMTYAGAGSWVIFDYVLASVLRGENTIYGEARLKQFVAKANERWQFGLDPEEVAAFLAPFGFALRQHTSAAQLEEMYFRDASGRRVGRVNGTHGLVLAEVIKDEHL
jgi:methyltransferase (TIGR00027 family)